MLIERAEGALQASKPRPVKIVPDREAPPVLARALGSADAAAAPERGSTRIARRRPIASAGQLCCDDGVPRYTARRSSRTHIRGCWASRKTGQERGTLTLRPSKRTTRLPSAAEA